MTLHPLTSKGGAFVLKLGLIFKNTHTPSGYGYFLWEAGIRKDGPTVGRVKKCPVETFLVRGRIHGLLNAPSMGVGIRILFVAGKYGRKISIAYTNNRKKPTAFAVGFFSVPGFERDSNRRTASIQ